MALEKRDNMTLRPLSIEEFNTFEKKHALSNMYQTTNYALLKAESDYDYELIGLVNDDDSIVAASLILLHPIGIGCIYGYAPRGFLIDYQDEELLNIFTEELKKYYYEKNCVFIKINPNVKIGEVNKDFDTIYNENEDIPNILTRCGYKKLKNNLYFESQLPRFNAIIDLDNFKTSNLDKNTRNKIRRGIRKGLEFTKVGKDKIDTFYDIVNNKIDNDSFYYQDYYTAFDRDDSIDLFLVSINYNDYLINSQKLYDDELERNTYFNEKLMTNSSEKIINTKMNSDLTILSYKNDIMEATKGLNNLDKEYIAGALVVRHNDTASIILSGYNFTGKRYTANYFLHYSLISYYKDKVKYLDLNGVVGDFKNENKYSGLNRFKMGFNPDIYEYAGEYDLVIEPKSYNIFLENGILAKMFNKK